jgi:gliding motility-associated-like protein
VKKNIINQMKNKFFSALSAVALFLIPNPGNAQAPNLGSAANFVIFSAVGAVTNSGIGFLTKLTGHVGANSGVISGFGNVDGNMYAGGPQSALCATDLLSAYNQLNAAVPAFFPAPLLGNGQILTAGVYSISGAAVLNSNLILNAQGNPNAVFIFQIQGAFSTNTSSKVKLINGAKACNVFWKVEGLVDMAAGTSMKGTVIANNAAINMNAGDTLEGRALSTNGAITISQILGYTPIGCGSPLLTGPNGPALASTACYGLFSSDGPVTNSGVTTVTGDIGTNNGTTVGYNPLFVTGMIHPIPDFSTAQCATDLLNVYAYLNALPNDILLLYPAQFGHNLVLTPHTYLMNGATALTDSVYLNAEGNANAVFVIQINGAFSTSSLSNIILINGAQSKNVYWKVDGAVNLNNNSIFRGTIICNNGAINLTTGVLLDGRAFTTTGALSTLAMTVTIPSSLYFITPPANQGACSGGLATLSVVAAGQGITYQWRKGLINLVNGGNISGATTATLVINPVSITDTSSFYNVVIGGQCSPSQNSNNASLMLNNASVTAQPANQTACAGNPVSFSVAAAGPGLTYQWRKGVVNLVNGGNISGVNSGTLTFNPVNTSDTSSNYNVMVTGLCLPGYTSSNVFLKLNNPYITTEPVNQSPCAGNSVSFFATVTGPGPLTYQWRKGNSDLINGGNISGANSATLNFNPAGIADAAANYNLIVTGFCAPNDTSINVSLTLNNPNIITQPVNQTVCAGNSVAYSVSATGPGLTYQWKKGNSNIINGGNISGANSATLHINPAGVSDVASNYNVIITGSCSPNDTSILVSLSINSIPVAIASSNSSVCAGNSINLTTPVISGGTYSWTGPNGYSSSVQNSTILNSSISNAGTYSLVVTTNSCSSAASTVAVEVNNCISTDFFIPEGFSPNGDGINDVFFIRGITRFPNNVFAIYNRWGDKVFGTNSYNNTWDGKATEGIRIGGDELPVGTYFYVLDLGDGSAVYKGTIYLNR